MIINQIHIDDIKSIADEIEQNVRDCNFFVGLIGSKYEIQKLKDNYNKIILREISNTITTAIIDCKENKIESVTFYGDIKVSPKELFNMYKHFREAYSAKDNLYFYFFNEDKKQGKYRVSFFTPTNKQVNVVADANGLPNLTLNW